jgi:membrane protease YdiL (CAAX protease family)
LLVYPAASEALFVETVSQRDREDFRRSDARAGMQRGGPFLVGGWAASLHLTFAWLTLRLVPSAAIKLIPQRIKRGAQEGTAVMDLEEPSISAPSFLLKPFWARLIGPAWFASLLFYVVVAAVRFLAALSPYPLQGLFFLQTVAMWSIPFLFLTPEGRREIGLAEYGVTVWALLGSIAAGAASAVAFFALGMALYGESPNNWCISIRNYLHLDEVRGLIPPAGIFALYALPAILLNPIGEEILFRGLIRRAFSQRFNPAVGVIVSSLLFGLIYLYVHGLWRDSAGFHLRLASTAVAILLMALIGAVFNACRAHSGSLWPAMAAHAAFNLALLATSIHQFIR